MSQFFSLSILRSIGLGRSKKTSNRETPCAPAVTERTSEPNEPGREEPTSASRISVSRVRVGC
jgi:hypothetical protein